MNHHILSFNSTLNSYSNAGFHKVVFEKSTYVKGHEFEDYVVTLFNKRSGRYRLIGWTSDKKATNGVQPESNSYPDLLFEYSLDFEPPHLFAIECKWRKNYWIENNLRGIKWAEQAKIDSYNEYERKTQIPVWVAIGLGGDSNKPDAVSLIRLWDIQNPFIPEEILLAHRSKKPNHRFTYDAQQRKLINQYDFLIKKNN